MTASMNPSSRSVPVHSLDKLRPTPAKAGLSRTTQSESVGSSDPAGPVFSAVVRDAAIKHYGSVKATAISLNNVDASLMMREFDAGRFSRLFQYADADAKAAVADAISDAYGRLEDPKARARRCIREAHAKLEELAQFIEVA